MYVKVKIITPLCRPLFDPHLTYEHMSNKPHLVNMKVKLTLHIINEDIRSANLDVNSYISSTTSSQQFEMLSHDEMK